MPSCQMSWRKSPLVRRDLTFSCNISAMVKNGIGSQHCTCFQPVFIILILTRCQISVCLSVFIFLNPSSIVKLNWNDWNSKRLQLMNLVLFGLCNIGNRILLSCNNRLVIYEDIFSLKKTSETISENTLNNS